MRENLPRESLANILAHQERFLKIARLDAEYLRVFLSNAELLNNSALVSTGFDYIAMGASLENRILEYVDHLHEHCLDPEVITNGRYMPPANPGYSITMKAESLAEYEFPNGPACRS
jgi:L-alanine-DL-glutamate epimerase-like enolase superfamily enzyme